jgi:hypothetical protein
VLNSLTKSECPIYQTGLSDFSSSNSTASFAKFQNRLFTPSKQHEGTFKDLGHVDPSSAPPALGWPWRHWHATSGCHAPCSLAMAAQDWSEPRMVFPFLTDRQPNNSTLRCFSRAAARQWRILYFLDRCLVAWWAYHRPGPRPCAGGVGNC